MAEIPYLSPSTVFLLLLGLMYRLNELLAGHSALRSFAALHKIELVSDSKRLRGKPSRLMALYA